MILIPEKIIGRIKRQSERELPNEACGYLAGKDQEASVIYEMTNADRSPEHFSFIPEEQFKVLKESRTKGLELIAVYHSHPSTPARMSEEDIRLAVDPDIVYVIYSLKDGTINGFKVEEGSVIDEEVEVIYELL